MATGRVESAPSRGNVGESDTAVQTDTRLRIVKAAGQLFAERGFQKATVRDICEMADVNLASINYHFGGKEQLYGEVILYIHECRKRAFLPSQDALDASPEERLAVFVEHMLTVGQDGDHVWQEQLIFREMCQPSPIWKRETKKFIGPHFGLLLEILDELLPDHVPHHQRQKLGFTVIAQCVFYRHHSAAIDLVVSKKEQREHFSVSELTSHIVQTILATAASLNHLKASDQ